MISPNQDAPPAARSQNRAKSLLLSLASMEFGIALMGVLAVVLMFATLLEAKMGMEFSNWYFYKSGWFIALLAILCVNVLAATIVRFPWKKRWGFLLAHLGILVLLSGAMLTFWCGIDEQLALVEGEGGNDNIQLSDWGVFTVSRETEHGGKNRKLGEFPFQPGPFDWPEGKTFDAWPEQDGVKLKVLKYYRHARATVEWVAAEGKKGEPALRFAIVHADGKTMLESWLADRPLGGQGLPKIEILQAPADTMREDFLNPPGKDEDEDGILSLHFNGRMQRVPVGKNLGKRITLEDGKTGVEIVKYFADAKPVGIAQFESAGDEPNNPILELRIYLPDREEPLRELAFAKSPLLSLAAMNKEDCPVKFWYHQPAMPAPVGVEFLHTPDGKLYCRTSRDGKYVSEGEVRRGSSVEFIQNLQLKLIEYIPFASRKVAPVPVELAPNEKNPPGDAALVEVEYGDVKRPVWLMRNNAKFGSQDIATPGGKLTAQFGDRSMPLGFSLKLLKFTREMNPGKMGDAAFTSSVQIVDKDHGIDREQEIAMNRPLRYGKYVIYQSGFNELHTGEQVSILKVTYDPGRLLKYLGCLMICGGMALRYVSNSDFYKKMRRLVFRKDNSESVVNEQHVKKLILLLSIFFLGIASASAEGPSKENLDWDSWRYLPVQEGGRQKPLDTLARENTRMLANRADFADPETGQRLDATQFYLAMLFDWQGWDRPEPPPEDADLSAAYSHVHRPDKWDSAPLLWIGSTELQKSLGIAEKQTHVSPSDVRNLRLEVPTSAQTMHFLDWAEKLSLADRKELSPIEKKGLELAERYWSYMLLRMGQRLEILPLRGDPHGQWAPLAMLVQSEFDDKSDPGGDCRKAQEYFRKARAAYRKQDAQAFRESSADFLAAVRGLGPELGAYPPPKTIALEVDYNRWAPFRIAWILSLAAAVCILPSMILKWKPLHAAAWLIFLAAFLAMIAGFAARSMIAHRAPITNMYESVLSVAAGIAVLGLIYESIYRKRYLLFAASILSALVLLFAESCPSICDPSIRPLMPVLRSNFLLVVHVVPIMASYAAFAVGWILANVSLGGYFLMSVMIKKYEDIHEISGLPLVGLSPSAMQKPISGSSDKDFMVALSRLTLKITRLGVFLLTVGTILGGAWADLSWGRFWGWDPKEVWALITLLIYLIMLHARHIGWIADFGLAFGSVVSFVAVIMTWYGVNFVLGTGLHSYGSGSGGVGYYVLAGLVAQFVFLLAATIMKFAGEDALKRRAEDGNEQIATL